MRILHVAADARPSGGVGRYLNELVQAQRAAGLDVLVTAGGAPSEGVVPLDEPVLNVDVVHIHERTRGEHERLGAVVRTLHNHNFGCSSGGRYLGAGEPCLRPHGVGCVGNWSRCAHTFRVDKQVQRFATIGSELQQVRDTPAVIVASRFMASAARANGVRDAQLHVIPFPVAKSSPPLVNPTPVDPTGPLLFIGRLTKDKGVDVLLSALLTTPDIRLEVAGDGWQRVELVEQARRTAPGRVSFLGWLHDEEITDAYRRARAVIMPHRWVEPFGIVGLEAMWAARPVIASSSGGVLDWMDPGVTGFTVEPGNARSLAAAIQALVSDPGTGNRMGLAGRRRAESWDGYEQHVVRLSSVYEAALASQSS